MNRVGADAPGEDLWKRPSAGLWLPLILLFLITTIGRGAPEAGGWRLNLTAGAQGRSELTSEQTQVTKSNGRGSVLLRWPAPFPWKKGQRVLFGRDRQPLVDRTPEVPPEAVRIDSQGTASASPANSIHSKP